MKNDLSIDKVENIFSNRKTVPSRRTGMYSVLLPLVFKEGEVQILFEVRAKDMKFQPGEVCFPGGHIEPGENAYECAVRETCEELGLTPSDIRIYDMIDIFRNSSGSAIYAYLGRLKEGALNRIKLSENEVSEYFLVPLRFFTDNPPYVWIDEIGPKHAEGFPYEKIGLDRNYRWGSYKMEVPVYDRYEGHIIWGLTGRIIKEFANIIKEGMKI